MKRTSNNWFGENLLNSAQTSISGLQPLASTMSNALTSVGITPPSELGNLAQVFHDQIVAPTNQAVNSGQVSQNILGFIGQQVKDLVSGNSQSPLNQQIAQNALTAPSPSLFSSPITWVAIVAVLILIFFLFK